MITRRRSTVFLRTLPAWPVLLCLLLSAGTPSAAAAGISIVLMNEAVAIDQDSIHLGDIAVIRGLPQDHVAALAETIVGQSPLPGQTRFVDVDYIRIRLKQAGIDTAPLTFQGAESVRVTREKASLPAEAITKAVEMAIRSQMSWENADVTIDDIQFDENVALPTGKLSYRILPNRNEDYLGQTLLALHLFVDGELVKKLWVTANISVVTDVVVVTRPLGRQQPVTSADVILQRRNLAELPADAVRQIDDVIGSRTTRMIYPDTVVQTSMIAPLPVIKRGDIVKIVACSGPMTITATGMAKQQGAKGEMVHVVNTDSNRVITARVTGPGAVAVEF